jgi:hypothetical protein
MWTDNKRKKVEVLHLSGCWFLFQFIVWTKYLVLSCRICNTFQFACFFYNLYSFLFLRCLTPIGWMQRRMKSYIVWRLTICDLPMCFHLLTISVTLQNRRELVGWQCSGKSGMRLCACTFSILLTRKHQTLVSLVIFTYVLVSMLLLIAVSSWFSVLWIIPVMPEFYKEGARTGLMFSSPTVSLVLYPLPIFRPRLLISIMDSVYIPCDYLSMDWT